MGNSGNKGRLAMAMHPTSYFEGTDAVSPFEEELCYDETTKDIYFWLKSADGTMKRYSRTAEIQAYLDTLKNSGIFTSAAAFVNNRKIYRFYFDKYNEVVRLDPEIRVDSLYKYYAIRKTTTDSNGAYVYLTGVSESSSTGSTTVKSSLVDIEEVDSDSGDGSKVGKPCVGGLVEIPSNGDTYVVEFYDANRALVHQESYQAIAVRVADLDLAPDTSVTDMYIRSSQPYGSDGTTIQIYQGQKATDVEIETFLQYADGRTREITNERTIGGRLSYVGLDSIATDTITPDGTDDSALQTFQVTYTLVRTNASFSSSSTYTTSSGTVINPTSLTITKTIKVRIVADTSNALVKIIPTGYVDCSDASNKKIVMKYFGLYSNGALYDITSTVTYSATTVFAPTQLGVTQSLTVNAPYGVNQQLSLSFSVNGATPDASNTTYSPVTINGQDVKYISNDSTDTAASVYSGKFTGFKVFKNGTVESVSYADLIASDDANIIKGHTPKYVWIRDIINSSYMYTDIIDGSNNSIYYKSTASCHVNKNRPVLVEFLQVVTDSAGNATSVFVSGAMLHYVS